MCVIKLLTSIPWQKQNNQTMFPKSVRLLIAVFSSSFAGAWYRVLACSLRSGTRVRVPDGCPVSRGIAHFFRHVAAVGRPSSSPPAAEWLLRLCSGDARPDKGHDCRLQIAPRRMADQQQQGLAGGEVGGAGEDAGTDEEAASTEPEEEELYLSDPESSSSSTRDPRELRIVRVRYEVGRLLYLVLPDAAAGLARWFWVLANPFSVPRGPAAGGAPPPGGGGNGHRPQVLLLHRVLLHRVLLRLRLEVMEIRALRAEGALASKDEAMADVCDAAKVILQICEDGRAAP